MIKSRLLILCVAVSLSGCSSLPKNKALPANLQEEVQMPGFSQNIRAWGDTYSKTLASSAYESLRQERAANHGKLLEEVNALALSGGAEGGAFGAGLLCGWTKTGKRPNFKLVTGISTGALMAPFAFLGPRYDDKLQTVYTSISDKDIYKPYSMFTLVLAFFQLKTVPAIADNKPLANLIAKVIDRKMLAEIAVEHKKGRRLLVGTAELYSQRLVIWDIGAIASSGSPKALELVHKILLASSALPATFPPQNLEVIAAGKQYNEMHVDGGVEVQVMLFENAIVPFSRQELNLTSNQKREKKLYIIRNQIISPRWESVTPKLRFIAIRAIDTLVQSQSIGDLYRLYTYAQRDNFEYNLATVPDTKHEKSEVMFDNEYMKKLFAIGYQQGKAGYKWQHYPYGFDPTPKDNSSPVTSNHLQPSL